MRVRVRKKYQNVEADMTPMIDMTFQLIAFFMVIINFTEQEQNQAINLPSSELAKPPDAPFQEQLTLQLMKADSQGVSLVIFGGDQVPVARIGQLLDREKRFLESQQKSAADATVIIRADSAAKTGIVQKLIETCQDVGFEKFALRAKQEEHKPRG